MTIAEKTSKIREMRNEIYENARQAKIREDEALYHTYICQVKGLNMALEVLSRK